MKAEKKELQKIAAKRRVGGQEKDVSWPEKQLEEMSRKGTSYSRLQAFRENLRQTLGQIQFHLTTTKFAFSDEENSQPDEMYHHQ